MNRQGRIGGSTVAAILGISPYSSAWAEWASIVGLRPEREDTERFAVGRDLEAGLALAVTRKTGLWIGGEQMEIVHPRFRMMVGHIDGLAFDGPGHEERSVSEAVALVEHKTQFGKVWDTVPAHYQAQSQFYMWLTGLDRCIFSVLFSGFRYETYELKADHADQALIAWRCWRFWRDHCTTGIAPAIDDSDATRSALGEVYPEHEPGTIADLTPLAKQLAARQALKAAAKDIADELKGIENAIRSAFADAEVGCVDGVPVLTYRSSPRDGYWVEPTTVRTLRAADKKTKEAFDARP